MAYIAILLLVLLLTSAAFMFIRQVATQRAATASRAPAVQAQYLAESAANHAMWRLLNQRRFVNPQTVERRVAHNDDDAEEKDDEKMELNRDKLELGNVRYVGVRFLNVSIPKGVTITRAYVEFKAHDDDDKYVDLTIRGEAGADATRFGPADRDISDRPLTAVSLPWSDIPAWKKDSYYQTPDLAAVIQEIISHPGWSSGNALAILFRSPDVSEKRRAYAHDTTPGDAPLLHVDYGTAVATPFSPEPDKYIMHDLAGGRYGYKVRKHTDTTFATIATVGAMGDSVVHQGYVLYVLPPASILEAHFDTSSDGFEYRDDVFRGTGAPDYAAGLYLAAGGFDGGGLNVTLGNIDNNTINGMSGGWANGFVLASAADLTLSFRYNLTLAADYENDEYGQVLVSIDDVLYGTGGNDYVHQINGNGNGGSPDSSGWQQVEVSLGTVSPGPHALVIGGYNNKKTYNNESTDVLIDDVVIRR